jgi:hypothetical protein
MKYRKLNDLNDKDIIFIVSEIFNPKVVSNIQRNEDDNEISCEITMEWDDGEETFDLTDELTLTENNIQADFSITNADIHKWKQYLLAKGCNSLLQNSPYI